MEDYNVRITGLEINNFKNVKYGKLSFENNIDKFDMNILGLYGQNGSGKTALIDVLDLLKRILVGNQIPNEYANYINVDAEFAKMKYYFKIRDNNYKLIYRLSYECSLKKELIHRDNRIDEIDEELENYTDEKAYKVIVFDEELKLLKINDESFAKKSPIFSTKNTNLFKPKKQFDSLIGCCNVSDTDLLKQRGIVESSSRSYLFSRELLYLFTENAEKVNEDRKDDLLEVNLCIPLVLSLVDYGRHSLFVVNTTDFGVISIDALPLVYKYKVEDNDVIARKTISLNGTTKLPSERYDLIEKSIEKLNIALNEIIPELTIKIRRGNEQMLKNGDVVSLVQLYSLKNGKEILLKDESEGIKRIISILQLLVEVYNNPFITVVIDEMDSGVFEYLLGELLEIISINGKGQLIFTCHNLRPLETIDEKFVAFTTTNPSKRYTRLKTSARFNNLRDVYYRNIILESEPQLYCGNSNQKIAFALKEAGGDYNE